VNDGALEKFSVSSGPSSFILHPSSFRRRRPGQTAIEYLLVTVSLLFVFVMMYRSLQWYLGNQFTKGGIIVLRMYKEDPW